MVIINYANQITNSFHINHYDKYLINSNFNIIINHNHLDFTSILMVINYDINHIINFTYYHRLAFILNNLI